jgi:protein involved in polysaccharide export with SLBB domain
VEVQLVRGAGRLQRDLSRVASSAVAQVVSSVSMSKFRIALALILAVALAGCASQVSHPPAEQNGETAPSASGLPAPRSDAALDNLWHQRLTEQTDFPIGPGDLLKISVPNVRELTDVTARVDGKGNLLLPLVGSLHVAGLTEPEIRDHLANALHKYVYHPEINLLVKTYSSRVVGVMGAVRTPGLYVLNGPSDTVHDLIQRAGGLTDNAAREVLVSPAPPGSDRGTLVAPQTSETAPSKEPQASVGTTGVVKSFTMQTSGAVTNTALENNHNSWEKPPSAAQFDANTAYTISLDDNSPFRKYANLPVRPGDTLFVPSAGQVSVVGWVYHPKVLSVTHGLTTLNAVSAAGGLMWAADPTSVKILRREPGDQTKVIHVDLAAVQNGDEPDVALKANDVVDVGYSAPKIPGYAVYYALRGILSFTPAAMLSSGL